LAACLSKWPKVIVGPGILIACHMSYICYGGGGGGGADAMWQVAGGNQSSK